MSPSGEPRAASERIAIIAWWLLPVIFLLWLYREGLSAWFLADDFAWLSLLRHVRARHDLFTELFAPAAQGTIRPWSERGYFLLLQSLFGLDSLPFRIVAFATAVGDALLIAWVTRRATRSHIAGFLAPILWIANTALVRPMTWNSAYNELMCPLFLLSALALFIHYVDTGQRKFWWFQLVVFSLGFGVLEINVVYPAIAAAWVLFVACPADARKLLRNVLPLAGISVVYVALHRLAVPLPATGAYALRFDLSILKTLALYCKWSLTPEPMARFGSHRQHAITVAVLIGALGVLTYCAGEFMCRRTKVLFYLTWFIVTLAPMLPLAGHRTDYYLTIPVIGVAMLGGAAAGQYLNASMIQRVIAAIPIAVYLWVMVPVTRAVTLYWETQSRDVRTLVLGVTAARQSHPGKAIVLDGVTTELFNNSFADSPFPALGIDDVYLATGSELTIKPDTDTADLDRLVLEPNVLWHGITHGDVVVYSLETDHLRNITEGFRRQLGSRLGDRTDRLPSRVDVGNILYSWLLGPTWLVPESGIRWMPGSATVRIGVPQSGGQLELNGRCPSAHLLAHPRHLMVLVDGIVIGDTRIYDPESSFRRLFPMPDIPAGKTSAEVQIRVDPVDRNDGQDYGLVFGKISVQP